jgi:hypothetical protein
MATWLKQSTAVDIALGPFVDSTDGFTAETALTLAQADIRLKKNAGAWAQKSETTSAAHEENGWYEVNFNATDTGTLGILVVAVNETGALPVWREFMVVAANVYDSIVGGGDTLDVQVTGVGTDVITAASIQAGAIGAAEIADGAIDAATFAAGAITATVIATGAIDADALAADTITAAKVAADVSAEIADAVWDEDATAHQTTGTFGQAIGDPVADTNTIYKAVVTDAAGATVGVDVVAVQADTDNIQTRLPAALVSGRIDASVGAMAVNVLTAAATAADFTTEVTSGLATATDVTNATANLDAAVSTRATPAQVNTEVVDALNTDTYAEPGQESPPSTTTLVKKLGYLYKAWRNRHTQTASEYALYADDATTKDQEAVVSDDATTFDRGEISTGA